MISKRSTTARASEACDVLIFVSQGSIIGSKGPIGDYLGAEAFRSAFPRRDIRIVRFCDPTTEVTFEDGELRIAQDDCPRVTLGKCRSFVYFPASFEPEDVALRPVDGADGWSRYLHRQWRVVSEYIEHALAAIGPCINDPVAARRGCNKMLQAAAARAQGLRLPETTVTNAAASARQFADGRSVVRKYISEGPSAPGTVLSSVRRIEIADLRVDGLPEGAPLAYQEFIESSREVRLYVIGASVIAVEIERKGHVVDIRYQGSSPELYKPTDEFAALYPSLVSFVRSLGLFYAVIDAIPSQGGLTILELNVNGTWSGMPERIAATIGSRFFEAVCERAPSA